MALNPDISNKDLRDSAPSFPFDQQIPIASNRLYAGVLPSHLEDLLAVPIRAELPQGVAASIR